MRKATILALLVGLLAVVNYRGVRAGAHLIDFFAVAKLLPLVAFIGTGLFFVRSSNFLTHAPAAASSWLEALLLLVFAFGGFEGAVIPMSEAKDPRRDAPFALFTALATTTVVYTLTQVVVSGVLVAPQDSDRPLAAAAGLRSVARPRRSPSPRLEQHAERRRRSGAPMRSANARQPT